MKIFLSDKIYEQVVKVNYKNGQIFCNIKNRITFNNKELIFAVAIILGVLFDMPDKSEAIGVSPVLPSVPEIHRPAQQTVPEYIPIISPYFGFVKPSELYLFICMMDKQFIIAQNVSQLIKRFKGGSFINWAIFSGHLFLCYKLWELGLRL